MSVDDKREDMERFLKAANVSFTTVRDAGQKLVAAADVSAMPTSFLIDRAGKIRYVHKGFLGDETVKQYQQQIQLLLKEPAPCPERPKPKAMKKRAIIFAPVALLLALAGGCTHVKPWQRGTLADPIMQPDRDPLGAGLTDHVYFSREAASGGRTVGGAGCGCN